MAVLKSNMIFIFKCWGVQRKPSSFPEVYLKLRDEKNREIICIYSIDDVIDKEKKKDTEMTNKIGVIEATNNLLTSNLLNLFVIQSIGTIIYTIIR